MVKRATLPQYAELARVLIEKIKNKTYHVGGTLPTEKELEQEFKVSRTTVRAALYELEQKGMISRHSGLRTTVERSAEQVMFIHESSSVDDILLFTEGVPLKILGRTELVLSADWAKRLDVSPHEKFLKLTALRQVGEALPITYSTHYIPFSSTPSLPNLEGITHSLAQVIAEAQADQVMRVQQTLEAAKVDNPEEANYLRYPLGGTALMSIRWYFGHQDRLLLVSNSIFPSGRYIFRSTLRRHVVD